MKEATLPAHYAEVVAIIRDLHLEYPVVTRDDFVARISNSRDTIVFRDIAYDAAFGASLLPAFYFPITSEQDLLAKAIELMMARGLVPVNRT